jgi:co-chaperonin GroES (HSP10)
MKALGTIVFFKPVNEADLESRKNTNLGFSPNKEQAAEEAIRLVVVLVGQGYLNLYTDRLVPLEVQVGDIVTMNVTNENLRQYWKDDSRLYDGTRLWAFDVKATGSPIAAIVGHDEAAARLGASM